MDTHPQIAERRGIPKIRRSVTCLIGRNKGRCSFIITLQAAT